MYAQHRHGHVLTGCKSSAGKPVLFHYEMILTAIEWQVQIREGLCEESQPQNCEPMDKNVIIRPSLKVSGRKITKPAG